MIIASVKMRWIRTLVKRSASTLLGTSRASRRDSTTTNNHVEAGQSGLHGKGYGSSISQRTLQTKEIGQRRWRQRRWRAHQRLVDISYADDPFAEGGVTGAEETTPQSSPVCAKQRVGRHPAHGERQSLAPGMNESGHPVDIDEQIELPSAGVLRALHRHQASGRIHGLRAALAERSSQGLRYKARDEQVPRTDAQGKPALDLYDGSNDETYGSDGEDFPDFGAISPSQLQELDMDWDDSSSLHAQTIPSHQASSRTTGTCTCPDGRAQGSIATSVPDLD